MRAHGERGQTVPLPSTSFVNELEDVPLMVVVDGQGALLGLEFAYNRESRYISAIPLAECPLPVCLTHKSSR